MKLLSIVIPISGEISNLQNLRRTLEETKGYESDVDVILLFDEKDTRVSYENWEEISSWKRKNMQIYRRSFSSVGAARNYGISKANSKWVSFTDADDVNLVSNFVSMIQDAELDGSDVAIGGFDRIQASTGNSVKVEYESYTATSFQEDFGLNPGIWRCAFRIDGIKDVDFPDINMAEDQVFLSRIFNLERTIHFSTQVVYYYFIGSSNSLTSKVEEVAKISTAIPLSIQLASETEGPYLALLETLAISQILTSIKYGSLKVRLTSLIRLIRFLSEGFYHRALQRFKVIIRISKR